MKPSKDIYTLKLRDRTKVFADQISTHETGNLNTDWLSCTYAPDATRFHYYCIKLLRGLSFSPFFVTTKYYQVNHHRKTRRSRTTYSRYNQQTTMRSQFAYTDKTTVTFAYTKITSLILKNVILLENMKVHSMGFHFEYHSAWHILMFLHEPLDSKSSSFNCIVFKVDEG